MIVFMFILLNRNCIGMNFAMAEMKVAVAMILKRYVLLTLFHEINFLLICQERLMAFCGSVYLNFISTSISLYPRQDTSVRLMPVLIRPLHFSPSSITV